MTWRWGATPSICIELLSLLVIKRWRVVKPTIPACTCSRNRRFLSAEIPIHKHNINVIARNYILDKSCRSHLENNHAVVNKYSNKNTL